MSDYQLSTCFRRMGLGHAHQHENVSIDWDTVKWDELTPEEKWNLEHIRLNIFFIKKMFILKPYLK